MNYFNETDRLSKYEELIAMYSELYDYDVVMAAIDIITDINGFNEQTLDDVNYVLTGYRTFEQLLELDGDL